MVISFQPTADERAFVEVARQFAKNHLRPAAKSYEEIGKVDDRTIQNLHDLGLLTTEQPEYVDGLELPLVTQVQIQRGLSYGDLAAVQGMPGLDDGASLLRVLADQQHMYQIDDIVNKQSTIAYIHAMDEEAFSSLQFTQGILSGTSVPIRSSKIATHFLIATVNEQQEAVLILVENDQTKIEVTGTSYLGLIAANIGKVTFHSIELNNEHIVATGEEAETLIEAIYARILTLQAAKQVGLMEAACDYVTEYSATRKAFGQEIAKFQAVSFRIAKMLTQLQISNHFVLEAAEAIDHHRRNANRLALKTSYQAHQAIRYITDAAVQLLGGHGFVQDYPVEKWMRDAQAQVMLYGSERRLKYHYGMNLTFANEKVVIE